MSDLFKYRDGDYVYYYASQEIMDIVNKLNKFSESNYKLYIMANFVINTRTNEIIKNRYSIESVVDEFLKKETDN
jgi:hypothetical protein